MRLVFAGTPVTAVPSLDAIAASTHELVGVVTRPPSPQGRSARLVPSPVEEWARQRGVEVLTPEHPKDRDFCERLTLLAPDCCPVVAYGALLPQRTLDIPTYGWVNLHYSLLPAYRGAAPVQRALMDGVGETGATTFRIVRELDAGPVYGTITEPVGPLDTAGELLQRLSVRGADLLVETLDRIADGAQPTPQPDTGVSYAAKLELDDVRIDWSRPARELADLVRGANPEPGAWTTLEGDRFRILLAEVTDELLPPGVIVARRREVLAGTGTTALRLLTVQPVGKKPMGGADWGRGARLSGDEVFA
ncbi:MAG TPA: methionyl-tRNA formyltransferase [Propionibacteriaceae bacterium]|nr:methionyl-tRNA formyltransferase [Propionibacteriaceae bacterium]